MVIATELRAGSAVRIEGQVYKVLEIESKAGTAKLGGVVKAKLSNVASGHLWEPHFRPLERLEDLELERRTMEFLFSDEDGCTFMDLGSFEQVQVPVAIVGSCEKFLEPGMQIPVEFFGDQPISIVFPDIVEARVADTAPAAHSQQGQHLQRSQAGKRADDSRTTVHRSPASWFLRTAWRPTRN